MKSVKLSSAALLGLVSKATLVDQLCAQQGAFMARKGLDKAPVKLSKIRRYARGCMKGLKANLKAAGDNERQINRLAKAYGRRVKPNGKEFLLAA